MKTQLVELSRLQAPLARRRVRFHVLVSSQSKLFVFRQGVAYVMHAADLDHQTAIVACKQCRPVVDPIGRFLGKFQFRNSHWIDMGKRDT